MKKITVGIPAYNAHHTLPNTLYSIINQSLINDITVIIVDDYSATDYIDLLKPFQDIMDIKLIRLEQNAGPGTARQVALEACITPYITFIDSDDIYIDGLFMKGVVEYLDNDPNCTNVNAMFLEEAEDGRLIKHDNDATWVFGKIYRMSYLKQHNITFTEARSNEDLEFNLKVDLYQESHQYTQFIHDKQVYLWRYNPTSITRKDDQEYSYRAGIIGAIEAKIRSFNLSNIQETRKQKIIVQELPYLYNRYLFIASDRPDKPEWLQEVLIAMKQLYRLHIKSLWDHLSIIEQAYIFNNRKLQNVQHIVPFITFQDFIAILESN